MQNCCERATTDDASQSVATHQLRRRPGPPVAPKTRPKSRESAASTASLSSAAATPSSSLEELTQPTTSAQPLPSISRQLIRDLERRQLELRQRGIIAASEVLDAGGVDQ